MPIRRDNSASFDFSRKDEVTILMYKRTSLPPLFSQIYHLHTVYAVFFNDFDIDLGSVQNTGLFEEETFRLLHVRTCMEFNPKFYCDFKIVLHSVNHETCQQSKIYKSFNSICT